jgi:putative transposase
MFATDGLRIGQQVAGGIAVGEVCRQVGISEQTFYRWKKDYGGMLPSEARELKQLREENANLKRLVADSLARPGHSAECRSKKVLKPVKQRALTVIDLFTRD